MRSKHREPNKKTTATTMERERGRQTNHHPESVAHWFGCSDPISVSATRMESTRGLTAPVSACAGVCLPPASTPAGKPVEVVPHEDEDEDEDKKKNDRKDSTGKELE